MPYILSPSPQQHGSHTKTSAQREWKGKRRKRAGKTVSCNMECGEKIIKEEAKDVCARPQSGIRPFVMNDVSKNSMGEDYEDEYNKESNDAKDKNANSVRTGIVAYLFPPLTTTARRVA